MDLILALDASADSHSLWFEKAEEYAVARKMKTWPRVRSGSLFSATLSGIEGSGSDQASSVVDDAKAQELDSKASREPRMPESQSDEPPLGRCNIWLGCSKDEVSTCRNDSPTVEDVMERDGIALAYFPLTVSGSEDVGEVWSTWKSVRFFLEVEGGCVLSLHPRFDFEKRETDALIALSKGAVSPSTSLSCRLIDQRPLVNLKSGEQALKTLIRGLWMRKRQHRLDSEADPGSRKDAC